MKVFMMMSGTTAQKAEVSFAFQSIPQSKNKPLQNPSKREKGDKGETYFASKFAPN